MEIQKRDGAEIEADGTEIVEARDGRLPADENPANVYLARLTSESSRRTMRSALDRIASMIVDGADAEAFPWERLRYQHTAAIRARLLEDLAPSTVNKYLSAIRGVLEEAWKLGHMTAEEYQRAASVESISHDREPSGRRLTAGEIRALFTACAEDAGPAGVRDAAIFALLYGAGLRRSEIVNLDLSDYNAETGELTVRNRKGRSDLTAWATNGAGDALAAWIEFRGEEEGPLFCPVLKGGRIRLRDDDGEPWRLSEQAVYKRLKRRSNQAGVQECSPHDLRRTFVSDVLDGGADLSVAAELAGHKDVQTTARYDRRGEEAKRRAAELLTVPFAGGEQS